MDSFIDFEIQILNGIQHIFSCGFMDALMKIITFSGNGGIIWIAASIVLLFFKKTRGLGIRCLLALALSAIVANLIIKPLAGRIRPYELLGMEATLKIPQPNGSSFPSGHSCSSFACAVSLYRSNKKIGVPAITWACAVAFSRLYFFVHYPSDVLSGAVIGVLCAIAVDVVYKKIVHS